MSKTKNIALLGIFAAFIFLFGITPLGLIPLGFINLTLIHIPVIIGAMTTSRKTSLVLGATFGLVSALAAFGIMGSQSGLSLLLLGYSPLAVLTMCFVPRILIPINTRLVYDSIIKSNKKKKKTAIVTAAIVGSLTNTVFYLGFMGVFFAMFGIWGNFTAILSLPLIVGATGEAIVAALIAVPVVSAVNRNEPHNEYLSVKEGEYEEVLPEEETEGEGVSDNNVAVMPSTQELLPTLTPDMQKRHDKCMQYLNDGHTDMANIAFDAFCSMFRGDDFFCVNIYVILRYIENAKYRTAALRLDSFLSKIEGIAGYEEKHLILGTMNIIRACGASDAQNPVHAATAYSIFTEATDLITADKFPEAGKMFIKYIEELGCMDHVIVKTQEEKEDDTVYEAYNTDNFGSGAVFTDGESAEGISEVTVATIPTAHGIMSSLPYTLMNKLSDIKPNRPEARMLYNAAVGSAQDEDTMQKADLYVILTYIEERNYAQALLSVIDCMNRGYTPGSITEDTLSTIDGIFGIISVFAKNFAEDIQQVSANDKLLEKAKAFAQKGAYPLTAQILDKYFVVSGLAK